MSELKRQRVLVRAYVAVGVTALGVAIVAGAHTFSWGLPSLIPWEPEPAASVLGGAGTVAAVFFGLAQFASQQLAQRSKHCLEAACEGIRRAHAVIEADEISRNICWVNAARLILRSLDLAEEISEEDHQRAWKLFREEWRIRFVRFLDAHLPYYFGVQPWQPFKSMTVTKAMLDTFALQSTTRISLEIEGLSTSSTGTTMISLRALKVVYDFVAAYDPGDEPLEKSASLSSADEDGLLTRDHYGLLAYLKTRGRYLFSGGNARSIEEE